MFSVKNYIACQSTFAARPKGFHKDIHRHNVPFALLASAMAPTSLRLNKFMLSSNALISAPLPLRSSRLTLMSLTVYRGTIQTVDASSLPRFSRFGGTERSFVQNSEKLAVLRMLLRPYDVRTEFDGIRKESINIINVTLSKVHHHKERKLYS